MPELPEVETVRSGLEQLVLHKVISSMTIKVPKMVKTDLEAFCLTIPGQKIQAIGRRGKYLLFDFGQWVMISHLRMEGKYLLFEDQVPDNKHFHVFLHLNDGSTLVYQDVRKFGTFDLIAKEELDYFFKHRSIGPEPTAEAFDQSLFEKRLLSSRKPIKPYLLDQSLVAGLGNIYVDEVLWAAQIHPERRSDSLEVSEIKRLHREIIRILQLAVQKGGSTIRTYRSALGMDGTMQNYLMVYGQKDNPCPRCGHPITKIKVGGRGTHLCPNCQRK